MPNWCSNKIEISHNDPAMIEKFNCETPLQAVAPCPFDPVQVSFLLFCDFIPEFVEALENDYWSWVKYNNQD